MDKFLVTRELLKLTQEGIENLKRPILGKEIELIVKNLLNDHLRSDGFDCEFHQPFREELT